MLIIWNINEVSSTIANSTSCGFVNRSITISQDITFNGTCFTINTSSLVLDCGGYSITGNSSGYGVNLTNFNNITIENCNLLNFSKGIGKENYDGNVNYTIRNNIINTSTNGGDGILLVSSENLTIFNNTIITTGNNSDAFNFNPGVNESSIIFNTLITYGNYSYGILLAESSNYNNISNNTIITNGYISDAIDSPSCKGNDINNNNITVFGVGGGVDTVSGTNNTRITNNIITRYGDDSSGLELSEYSNNNTLSNNIVTNNGTSSPGIEISDSAYNNTIINCVLNATNSPDVELEGAGPDNTFINVTFDKTDIHFQNTSDTGSIVVKWYVDVNVTNLGGVAINGTNVSIYNVTGNYIISKLTGTDGMAQFNLTEFWQNASDKVYYTPHTINGSHSRFVNNQTTVNLITTSSTTVNLVLTSAVLEASLVSRTSDFTIAEGGTFNFSTSVNCTSGDCGNTSAYLFGGGNSANTSVGATPFYTTSNNPQNCSILNITQQTCNTTWVLTLTGSSGNEYALYALYNSTNENVSETTTTSINLCIGDCTSPGGGPGGGGGGGSTTINLTNTTNPNITTEDSNNNVQPKEDNETTGEILHSGENEGMESEENPQGIKQYITRPKIIISFVFISLMIGGFIFYYFKKIKN